jgi:hypothetical protein
MSEFDNQNISYSGPDKNVALQIMQSQDLSGLLTDILYPAVNARKHQMLGELGIKLKQLEDEEKIKIDELNKDDQFIDTAVQATSLAIKTGDKEKVKIFQNIIINAALGETPDQTLCHIFLNLIDVFTIWHIKILILFNNPTQWFNDHDMPAPTNIIGGALTNVVYAAYPELNGQRELVDLIWADLGRAKLHNTSELGVMMTGNALFANRTTPLGQQFINFISEL